ncbi:MAG: glycosyltransferase family 39 protein [Planctomycetota bacterium]
MTRSRWGLIALLTLAALVRLAGLHSQSLTMDECLEIELAQRPLAEIIAAPNSFPPLYHILLKLFMSIDPSLLAVRHFSVLCGLFAVLAMKRLGTEAVNARTGWVAGVLAAVAPFHVYYSQQGRGYMLIMGLASWALIYGLRLSREASWRDRLGFVLIAVAGGYTHYYFAVLLVAIACGVLAVRGLRFAVRELLPLAAIIGLGCAPLLGLVRADLDYQKGIREARPMDVLSLGYTFFSFESGYTLGPSRRELHHSDQRRELVRRALPLVATVGIVAGGLLCLGTIRLVQVKEWPYWLMTLGVPFGVIGVLSAVCGVTYNTRFVVFCWMPYALVTATALASLSTRWLVPTSVALLTIYGTALYNRHAVPQYQNEDTRGVARFLVAQPQRTVFICAGYMDKSLRTYLPSPWQVVGLQDQGYPDGSPAQALEALSDPPCWLVYVRPFHGDPEGVILDTLRKHRGVQVVYQAAGVTVFDCGPLALREGGARPSPTPDEAAARTLRTSGLPTSLANTHQRIPPARRAVAFERLSLIFIF